MPLEQILTLLAAHIYDIYVEKRELNSENKTTSSYAPVSAGEMELRFFFFLKKMELRFQPLAEQLALQLIAVGPATVGSAFPHAAGDQSAQPWQCLLAPQKRFHENFSIFS